MSSLARRLVYGAFLYGGMFRLQGWRSRLAGGRLTIVTLHRVDDRAPDDPTSLPTLFLSRSRFDGMLKFLSRHFRFVSLEQIRVAFAGGGTLPADACHLTFDDAYQDVFDHALPVLKRADIPATVFLPTQFVGGRIHAFWWDECYYLLRCAWTRRENGCGVDKLGQLGGEYTARWDALRRAASPSAAGMLIVNWIHRLQAANEADRRRLMDDLWQLPEADRDRFLAANRVANWDTVRSAAADGFSFGSHTCSHPFLDCESEESARRELSESRQEIERQLGHPVDCFAYPGGKLTAEVRRWVADAGYRLGMTTTRGVNRDGEPPLLLKRVSVWNGSASAGRESFSRARLAFTLRRRIA